MWKKFLWEVLLWIVDPKLSYLIRTNYRAYLFLRTTISSNLNRPKYFKEIDFDRSFINIFEILLKRKALDIAYLYCLKEIKQKKIFIFLSTREVKQDRL